MQRPFACRGLCTLRRKADFIKLRFIVLFSSFTGSSFAEDRFKEDLICFAVRSFFFCGRDRDSSNSH
jgi:hypothetical protein